MKTMVRQEERLMANKLAVMADSPADRYEHPKRPRAGFDHLGDLRSVVLVTQ